MSRDTCMRMFTYTRFSYCMETLVQAGTLGLRIHSVDIGVNPKTRESRLFGSIPEYLVRSGWTIIYMFILYRPGRFFGLIGTSLLVLTLVLGFRF
ncbi:MAG: glycosyltransferase family 2 protein, partial [Akkermansiaceae bacterium]|nr:glycosyltransferase family 2 protein [Akkermansiaceae bacterium]